QARQIFDVSDQGGSSKQQDDGQNLQTHRQNQPTNDSPLATNQNHWRKHQRELRFEAQTTECETRDRQTVGFERKPPDAEGHEYEDGVLSKQNEVPERGERER